MRHFFKLTFAVAIVSAFGYESDAQTHYGAGQGLPAPITHFSVRMPVK